MSPATRVPSRTLTLTRILTQAGVVTEQEVDLAIARQRETGQRSGELLVQMGVATEEDIGWALARQLDLTFIDPRPDTLDHELIHSFPEELLRRLDALPLVVEDDTVAVAFADPTQHEAIEEITQAAGRPVRLAVATPSAIRRALRGVFGVRTHERSRQKSVDVQAAALAAAPTGGQVEASVATRPAKHVESHPAKHATPPKQHQAGAVFLLERLNEAFKAGAAEIHLLPHPDRLDVWHRIAGRLTAAEPRSRDALIDVLAWIEALDGPTLTQDERHAWGRIKCPAGPTTIDLGVSLLRQPAGICVTLEPLPPQVDPQLDWLGFDAVDVARLREALNTPAGLGLIAGPPGSGGSTTLEAMAAELERATRRCVRWDAGVASDGRRGDSTALGLSTAALHGADVVVLDDVPAKSLAETLAPTASGRWVLARVEAADTFALLAQLAATPLERAALAERLRFVVQLRRAWLAREAASQADASVPRRCSVFEVLIVEDGLRQALRAGERGDVLRARADAAGFTPLSRRLHVLVRAGLVSPTEAARLVA